MNGSAQQLKSNAIEFLELAAAGKVDEAYQLVAPHFCHHNPYFQADAESLKSAMRENARLHPDKTFEVQRALVDGGWVAVHSKVNMPSTAMTIAVVHLFRFEAGKIAELWDVGQAQPEQMVNQIGMF